MFFFKQKTAYEMRISDWSSDVCSSDLQTVSGIKHPDEQIADRDQQPQPDETPRRGPRIGHREAQQDEQRDADDQHDGGMGHGGSSPLAGRQARMAVLSRKESIAASTWSGASHGTKWPQTGTSTIVALETS